jgi:hypothetical protein
MLGRENSNTRTIQTATTTTAAIDAIKLCYTCVEKSTIRRLSTSLCCYFSFVFILLEHEKLYKNLYESAEN